MKTFFIVGIERLAVSEVRIPVNRVLFLMFVIDLLCPHRPLSGERGRHRSAKPLLRHPGPRSTRGHDHTGCAPAAREPPRQIDFDEARARRQLDLTCCLILKCYRLSRVDRRAF